MYSDTASVSPQIPTDPASVRDSMNTGTNTKTTAGGRKTTNNNTGNGLRNVNAAVSDTTGTTR
ncbi:hypothetical protein [Chryseobacterium populi]|uniref:Uncharacterized protein n=1 Tax=Chryseobacterium populi TaxID=1144316 RepID=J3CIY7_9FLAO|nr:hypothetical protein [Chryseobacterium populi]EJL72401.1 hypothetical protein PMI13_01893 [Chryseobacterium populi]